MEINSDRRSILRTVGGMPLAVTSRSWLGLARRTALTFKHNYSGAGYETSVGFARTFEKQLVLAGSQQISLEEWGMWLLVADNQGSTILNETYMGSHESSPWPVEVVSRSDGGYFLVGYDEDVGKGVTSFILRVDQEGNKKWHRSTSTLDLGPVKTGEKAAVATATKDGGLVVSGPLYHYVDEEEDTDDRDDEPSSNVWVAKFDPSGEKEWVYTTQLSYPYRLLDLQSDNSEISLYWYRGYDEGDETDTFVERRVLSPDGRKTARNQLDLPDEERVATTIPEGFLFVSTYEDTAIEVGYSLEIRSKVNEDLRVDHRSLVTKTRDGGFLTVNYEDSFISTPSETELQKWDGVGEYQWSHTLRGYSEPVSCLGWQGQHLVVHADGGTVGITPKGSSTLDGLLAASVLGLAYFKALDRSQEGEQ